MKRKLSSSALILALVVGLVLSTFAVGGALVVSRNIQLSHQTREGKSAYRAALSGIEDGLLRYKYARSRGGEAGVFGDLGEHRVSQYMGSRAAYHLFIEGGSLTSGNPDDLANPLTGQTLRLDDTIEINLVPFLDNTDSFKDLDRLRIYFTAPYQEGPVGEAVGMSGYFTALNWRLFDLSKEGEAQLLGERTNLDASLDTLSVDNISTRCQISSDCRLRVRPQTGGGVLDREAGRIIGENGSSGGKFIYWALEAYDRNGNLITGGAGGPGQILIRSIGKDGRAERKMESRIDALSGGYLGHFDFGVYCGKECEW